MHAVIETRFEMLKYSEHRNHNAIQVIKSLNFFDFLKVFSWSPNFNLPYIPYIIHPLALQTTNK